MNQNNATLLVYLPGGPGLNPNPERNLLVAPLQAAGFEVKLFEEPSQKRGHAMNQYDFNAYLDAARALFASLPVDNSPIVLAHCFGAIPACLLSEEFDFRALVLAAPSIDQTEATRNVLRVAAKYMEEATIASELRDCARALNEHFDMHAQKGLGLAATDPGFMINYWNAPDAAMRFMEYYEPPKFDFDVDAFFAIRSTLNWTPPKSCPVPTKLLLGASDPIVIDQNLGPELQASFPNLETIRFEHSAHFPHIEETDRLIQILSKL